MKKLLTVGGVVAVLGFAQAASAQPLRGFAFGGVTADANAQTFPAFGGGVLVDLGQPWIAAGAQGEAFVDFPYFAGRGAVFAEGRILPRSRVRPFVLAGAGFGEGAAPLIGGGVEIRVPGNRFAFRLAIEDYVWTGHVHNFGRPARKETRHNIATRIGITF